MKKFVCLLTLFLMISLTMSAQASGGQITRKRMNTTTKTNTVRKNNSSGKTTRNGKRDNPQNGRSSRSASSSAVSSSSALFSPNRDVVKINEPDGSDNGLGYASSNNSVSKINEPDGYVNGHGYVDLGLPSGTKWATCNIGAKSPEQYGDYFAWGETTGYNRGKTDFSWETYKWCNGSHNSLTKYNTERVYGTVDNKTELDLMDDAAYANWGPAWLIPSIKQFEELFNISYTNREWTTQEGVYGYKITSKKNGKSIFLPVAGCRYDSSLRSAGSYGYYWSRTSSNNSPSNARYLFFDSSSFNTLSYYRYGGRSVRPVRASSK